jgi:hypothetical protein
MIESIYGHKIGDDGGTFAAALASVRQWGGVLEHPAWSFAWAEHGLPDPNSYGGWQRTLCGGSVCCVEQGRYGHPARKATWLYAVGCILPSLRWGFDGYKVQEVTWRARENRAIVGWAGNRNSSAMSHRPRISKKAASATPIEFRDLLISMARTVRGGEE